MSKRLSSQTSSRSTSPSVKRRKSDVVLPTSRLNSIPVHGPINAYIVEAKLNSHQFSELVSLADSRSKRNRKLRSASSGDADELLVELCPDIRRADVVITAVRMRKRLERHLDWELAVSPTVAFLACG